MKDSIETSIANILMLTEKSTKKAIDVSGIRIKHISPGRGPKGGYKHKRKHTA